MKKILVIILSVLFMFGAFGCSGGQIDRLNDRISELESIIKELADIIEQAEVDEYRLNANMQINNYVEEKSKDLYSPSKWKQLEGISEQWQKNLSKTYTIEQIEAMIKEVKDDLDSVPNMKQEFLPYAKLSEEVIDMLKEDNIEYTEEMIYLGVHNGYAVFFYLGNDKEIDKELKIGEYDFMVSSTTEFYIWKPGIKASVEQAYNDGSLTDEDLATLHYIRHNPNEYIKEGEK